MQVGRVRGVRVANQSGQSSCWLNTGTLDQPAIVWGRSFAGGKGLTTLYEREGWGCASAACAVPFWHGGGKLCDSHLMVFLVNTACK